MKQKAFKLKNMLFILISGLLLTACEKNEKSKTKSSENYAEMIPEMDSIANWSQKVLLKKVSTAIEKGRTEYALEFCNLNALPIIDSLSNHFGVGISRITDKTRNPKNELKTETDKLVFSSFKENRNLNDSLISENNQFVYYKRINTAMPACIKCHGQPNSEINSTTLSKIKTLYPGDKATGYGLNDFRGLWKIVTNKK